MTARGIAAAMGLVARLAATVPGLAAQSPAERIDLTAYDARLSSGDAPELAREVASTRPPRARCTGSARDAVGEIRYGLALVQLASVKHDKGSLNRALDCFAVVVTERPDWPWAWYGLGITRLALTREGAIARAGPLQPVGGVYAIGAFAALDRALAADPSFTAAALGLASSVDAVYRVPIPSRAARDALRRTAGTAAGREPAVLLARARYERDAATRDSTLGRDSVTLILRRYLAAGGDTAVACLELAREAFAAGDAAGAATNYRTGAAHAARTREGREAYRRNLFWVASPDEKAEFDSTPDRDVGEWIDRFWARRDAESGRSSGDRLREHFRRYEYAVANFSMPIRYPPGSPSREILTQDVAAGVADTGDAAAIRRLFGDSVGAGRLLEIQHNPTDDLLDPRAPVYLRYGPPDLRAASWWAYYRNSGDIFVRVVPFNSQFPGDLCSIHVKYCLPQTPARAAIHDQEFRAMAEKARTTDEYPLRFRHPLEPIVQLYGLHGDAPGAPGRVLVVFAIQASRLESAPLDSAVGRVVYPLHFRLLAATPDGRTDTAIDTTRRFVAPHRLADKEYLVGMLELPLPPGRQNVRVVIEEPADRQPRTPGNRAQIEEARGAVVGINGLSVPPNRPDSLTLSDIVIGRSGTGLSWRSPGGSVPLNPLNAYPTGSDVDLYYEANGLVPGATYRTSISVSAAAGDRRPNAALATFEEQATGPRQEFRRTISLTGITPGRYSVTVSLVPAEGAAAGQARGERGSTINVVAR